MSSKSPPPPYTTPRSPSPAQQSTGSEDSMQGLPSPRVLLHQGLVGQDTNLDMLITLYEQLQVASVETAHEDDLLSFVENTYYFAVIHKAPESSAAKPVKNDDEWQYFAPVDYRFDIALPCLGFVYLTRGEKGAAAKASGYAELSIGIIITPEERGKGYARAAITEVLQYAFDKRSDCHRVQAILVESYYKERALHLFTQLRFGHEGTRRRSFYSFNEWKDTTCLGILNTDWAMRSYFKPAPKSLWDEMFIRHDRERDVLLRWEERKMSAHLLQKTPSMETIRDNESADLSSGCVDSETDDNAAEADLLYMKGKQTSLNPPHVPSLSFLHATRDLDDLASESDMERDVPTAGQLDLAAVLRARGASVTPSDSSSSQSAHPPSTCGSGLSDWEMMDDDEYFSPISEDDDLVEDEEP